MTKYSTKKSFAKVMANTMENNSYLFIVSTSQNFENAINFGMVSCQMLVENGATAHIIMN